MKQARLFTWFERDRAHVEIRCEDTQKTLVEWRDDAVGEAIEDGFLDPSDYFGSAIRYAESVGLIQKREYSQE
jgi:hypothetical protein